jgi:hypothetical protein
MIIETNITSYVCYSLCIGTLCYMVCNKFPNNNQNEEQQIIIVQPSPTTINPPPPYYYVKT